MGNDELSQAIGSRIKSIRNRIGLSQDEFSEMVDSDRTYICKIENGSRNLTIKKLCIMCEKCGMSLKDFFVDDSFAQYFYNAKENDNGVD